MGANLSGDKEDSISDINVTPFVDIILVVLIIFMVTTPIIMKPSINVNLPKAASGEESSQTELNISISSAGDIYLNGKPSTEDEVKSFASQAAQQKPDIQAIIAADKDTSHGKVVSIIDAIKSGGVNKFAISIDKAKK